MVDRRTPNEEADFCRAQARHFAGQPEEEILLGLASAFEKLVRDAPRPPRAIRRPIRRRN